MSAQSLLNSVFSCSSPAAASSKSLSKRRLRQTRSLDPAIIGSYSREEGDGPARAPRARAAGGPSAECLAAFSSRALLRPGGGPLCGSLSTPSTPLEKSPSGSFHFEYEASPRGKRNTAWELPFLARTPSASALSAPGGGTGTNSIFSSPRKWLQQRKGQQAPSSHPSSYIVWKSEGWENGYGLQCAVKKNRVELC
ncbi:unnamed protein product [Caretta caretta]